MNYEDELLEEVFGKGWEKNHSKNPGYAKAQEYLRATFLKNSPKLLEYHPYKTASISLNNPGMRDFKALKYFREQNYDIFRGGFPDFIVVDGGKIRWIEIKGPNEKLNEAQMAMHAFLKKAYGIDVEIKIID